MSVCKLIVEKYNGEIKFISHLDEGSNFNFTFETQEVEENPEPVQSSSLKRKSRPPPLLFGVELD